MIIFVLSLNSLVAQASGFLNQQNKYRGFYWFDDLQINKHEQAIQQYQIPTPSEAALAIEERKKSLDDARNQMIAVGFDQNAPEQVKREAILAYKKLEIEMWNGALSLVGASDMANFTNPEIVDNLAQPTNVFGVKLKRRVEAEQSALSILEFAKDFDLLLFEKANCPYCKDFAPVLTRFVGDNNFKLDVASLESNAGSVAKSLGITSVPTLVAVKKDGSQVFEISRGMISLPELENNILLAQKYSLEMTKNKPFLPKLKTKRAKS